MNTEVYIENYQLDVSKSLSTLLTYAIDDIKDFSSRNCSFSKTIVCPGTARNNKLFGNIFNVTISNPYNESVSNVGINFNPSVSASCIIFQDQIQVFKGTLRLLEIVIDKGIPEYECSVVGELGGLVAAIGKGKLHELDFSAYDHTYNVTNIQNSWDNTPGAGYYYPLIDYGAVSLNKIDYDLTAFRPALYVKEYLDKIFESAGYRYSSNLMTTDRFKRLIIPHNQKTLRGYVSELMRAERSTRYKVIDSAVFGDPPDEDYLKFETFTGNGFSADVDKKTFTYTDSEDINVVVSFSISGDYSKTFNPEILANILHNGSEAPGRGIEISILPEGNYLWTKTFNLDISNGDTLEFYYQGSGLATIYDVFASTCSFTISSNTAIAAPLNNGDDIVMADVIPQNILQVDFLRSVIKLFNLYVYESVNESRKLLIEPYVDFYDTDPSNAVDWTYKLDRSKAIRLKPMSELNSRFYEFKFKQDNDYYNELYRKTYNENYGDRVYDSEFEFTKDKTIIELIFSPTVLVGYSGVDKVVSTLFKKTSGVEEKIDTNIRILLSKKITGVTAWDIESGGADLVSNLTAYGYAGHFDDPDAPANDIHFGVPRELYFTLVTGAINVNQFNVYWSPYMAEITDKDSKLLIGHFRLTNRDINNLDFSKFIYLDGAYWRLNKIEDWNATRPETCKVELLKVINTLY